MRGNNIYILLPFKLFFACNQTIKSESPYDSKNYWNYCHSEKTKIADTIDMATFLSMK